MRQLMENKVQQLLDEQDMGTISLKEHEAQFLQDCIDKYGDRQLSERQEEWLCALYDRYILKA